MIRWLSREGRPPAPVRVTGTPLAVRVVDVPAVTAEEMPPRPQLRRGRGPEGDPCGGMPMTISSDGNGEGK